MRIKTNTIKHGRIIKPRYRTLLSSSAVERTPSSVCDIISQWRTKLISYAQWMMLSWYNQRQITEERTTESNSRCFCWNHAMYFGYKLLFFAKKNSHGWEKTQDERPGSSLRRQNESRWDGIRGSDRVASLTSLTCKKTLRRCTLFIWLVYLFQEKVKMCPL